jgi:FtsP/CotA-like multicopper oxidase with cupredoxin domain
MFLSNATRREIVIDFSKFPPGTELYLEDRIVQDDGRGPDGKFGDLDLKPSGIRLMKFIVGARTRDPSEVPEVLRPFDAISPAVIASAERRTFEFERRNGSWVINDEQVDLERPMATVQANTPQVWTLINKSGGWWHPIHVHLEMMRMLSRDGGLAEEEVDGLAKTDTVVLGPNSEVEVFFNFRDYPGQWVFHCHNIEHEDHFMMSRFDVTP